MSIVIKEKLTQMQGIVGASKCTHIYAQTRSHSYTQMGTCLHTKLEQLYMHSHTYIFAQPPAYTHSILRHVCMYAEIVMLAYREHN